LIPLAEPTETTARSARVHCTDTSVADPDPRRIHMFLGLPDPDPVVRYTDPDPSIIKEK
jgi:hypothetical protein